MEDFRGGEGAGKTIAERLQLKYRGNVVNVIFAFICISEFEPFRSLKLRRKDRN